MNKAADKKGLIDWIINDHFSDDVNLQFRARVLVSAWVLFLFSLVLSGVLTTLLPMKLEARLSAVVLTGSLSFFILLLILLFHKTANYRLHANLSIGLALCAIFLSIVMADSPMNSPTLGLFYVIPVLAVFFLGKASGLVWSAVTLSAFFLLLLLDSFNFTFLNFYDEAFFFETALMSQILGLVGMTGMVFSYELANRKLRIARDFENERYNFLANHDELTGLANRKKFDIQMQEAIAALGVLNKKERFALLFLDLDGFKPINDKFGHKAGDFILKTISRRIEETLNNAHGFAARHGGDEFLILLRGVQSPENIAEFLELLLNFIRQPIDFEGQPLQVSASIGVAIFPKHAQDIGNLIRCADIAMYKAKESKNGFSMYEDAIDE